MPTPVIVEQRVALPPDAAYAAWMHPEQLATWWWPHIADTVYQIDARVGGRYDIRSEAAGIGAQGEFLDLETDRQIVMSWRWMNDGVSVTEETVRVEFTVVEDGSLISVTHYVDDVVEDGESLREGWEDVLARLAQIEPTSSSQ